MKRLIIFFTFAAFVATGCSPDFYLTDQTRKNPPRQASNVYDYLSVVNSTECVATLDRTWGGTVMIEPNGKKVLRHFISSSEKRRTLEIAVFSECATPTKGKWKVRYGKDSSELWIIYEGRRNDLKID